VAFTWFEPLANGRPGFRQQGRLVDAWLRWRGEPFLSGMASQELAGFLSGLGFALQRLDASSSVQDTTCAAEQPIEGEYIALASRAPMQQRYV
jgi:hypothetical protein